MTALLVLLTICLCCFAFAVFIGRSSRQEPGLDAARDNRSLLQTGTRYQRPAVRLHVKRPS
jgi:hypothetical protein